MGEWKSGLFGCFDNIGLSCLTCCVWPLAVGKNAEAVGEKSPVLWVLSVNFAPCIAGALLRGLIRKQKVSHFTFSLSTTDWLAFSI